MRKFGLHLRELLLHEIDLATDRTLLLFFVVDLVLLSL
jgi:hypothetical protein